MEAPATPVKVPPSLRASMRLATGAWVAGSVWMTATAGAPLTEFARVLGAGPFLFGLLAALPFAASMVALPASVLTERLGRRKPVFIVGLLTSRLLWLAIALVPAWLWANGHETAALPAFLGLFFLSHAAGNAGGPAWVAWMGQLVPGRVRGAYFARRRQWGNVSALPTALIVGFVLDRYATGGAETLWVVAGVFCAAAAFGVLDILLFLPVPEPPRERPERPAGWSTLAGPLRDRRFLIFAGFVATIVLGAVPAGQFITLYLIEELGVGGFQVQLMLLVAPNLAGLASFGVWGRVVDKMGKKPTLVIGAVGVVPTIIGWVFVGHLPGGAWLGYLLTITGAVAWAAIETANFNFVLEFAGRSKGAARDPAAGSGYAAVNGVIVNVAGVAGGLLFGGVAMLLKDLRWEPTAGGRAFTYFEALFLLSAVLRASALLWLPFLHEDRARPAREAIRFAGVNLYNNVQTAVFAPVRLGRLRVRESLRARR